MKFFSLIFKNLRRNPIRTVLTSLTVMVLVSIFCMIATSLSAVSDFMSEKSRDIILLITERYRMPSRFNRSYIEQMVRPGSVLSSQLRQIPGFHPEQYTTWQFIGFTLDPEMKDKDKVFLVIATVPDTIPKIKMFDLDKIDPKMCLKMKNPPGGLPNTGILMGPDRLAKLGKRVGDIFKAKSFTHSEGDSRIPIEMEFQVIGVLPPDSRWSQAAIMDYVYLDRVLHEKKNEFDGQVDMGLLMVDDQESAQHVSQAIEGNFRDLKCETFATAVTRFMAPMRDFFWGLKFVVAPAIVVVMMVVVANAIGITVRERTLEMAILKVLGYGRGRILFLVLGEGMLIGALGGLLGGGGTQLLVQAIGGIRLPEQSPFFVSWQAWWWGPALGAATACVAGLWPAWNACRIKVSEVFAKVA